MSCRLRHEKRAFLGCGLDLLRMIFGQTIGIELEN